MSFYIETKLLDKEMALLNNLNIILNWAIVDLVNYVNFFINNPSNYAVNQTDYLSNLNDKCQS